GRGRLEVPARQQNSTREVRLGSGRERRLLPGMVRRRQTPPCERRYPARRSPGSSPPQDSGAEGPGNRTRPDGQRFLDRRRDGGTARVYHRRVPEPRQSQPEVEYLPPLPLGAGELPRVLRVQEIPQ